MTPLQLETLALIADGGVYQRRFGYAAWRIRGASPGVVGRLIAMKLAAWGAMADDTVPCLATNDGLAALSAQRAGVK